MRFEPESTDPDNAGLSISRDLLKGVKAKYDPIRATPCVASKLTPCLSLYRHPEISHADLWAIAGVAAIEFMGGPKIPFNFGRTDDDGPARCPANGRLPDASKGADHLRAVFGRMGFNDQEIVAVRSPVHFACVP